MQQIEHGVTLVHIIIPFRQIYNQRTLLSAIYGRWIIHPIYPTLCTARAKENGGKQQSQQQRVLAESK